MTSRNCTDEPFITKLKIVYLKIEKVASYAYCCAHILFLRSKLYHLCSESVLVGPYVLVGERKLSKGVLDSEKMMFFKSNF